MAGFQEGKLKEYRKITTRISELCKAGRGVEQEELGRYMTMIGGFCGEMLRNRDREE